MYQLHQCNLCFYTIELAMKMLSKIPNSFPFLLFNNSHLHESLYQPLCGFSAQGTKSGESFSLCRLLAPLTHVSRDLAASAVSAVASTSALRLQQQHHNPAHYSEICSKICRDGKYSRRAFISLHSKPTGRTRTNF